MTHLPPVQFKPLAKYARREGIKIIIAHGQTPVEPVVNDTNRLALEADIDILAHPGLITDADTIKAQERGIFLEITSRSGHSQSNNHVAAQARKFSAKLILNNDSHRPQDIISPQELIEVGIKSGLNNTEIEKIYTEVSAFLKKKESR